MKAKGLGTLRQRFKATPEELEAIDQEGQAKGWWRELPEVPNPFRADRAPKITLD